MVNNKMWFVIVHLQCDCQVAELLRGQFESFFPFSEVFLVHRAAVDPLMQGYA